MPQFAQPVTVESKSYFLSILKEGSSAAIDARTDSIIENYIVSELINELDHDWQARSGRLDVMTKEAAEAEAIRLQIKFWDSIEGKNKHPLAQRIMSDLGTYLTAMSH
jgi:hypothetical protein